MNLSEENSKSLGEFAEKLIKRKVAVADRDRKVQELSAKLESMAIPDDLRKSDVKKLN